MQHFNWFSVVSVQFVAHSSSDIVQLVFYQMEKKPFIFGKLNQVNDLSRQFVLFKIHQNENVVWINSRALCLFKMVVRNVYSFLRIFLLYYSKLNGAHVQNGAPIILLHMLCYTYVLVTWRVFECQVSILLLFLLLLLAVFLAACVRLRLSSSNIIFFHWILLHILRLPPVLVL